MMIYFVYGTKDCVPLSEISRDELNLFRFTHKIHLITVDWKEITFWLEISV